jgi:hypothetical protein
MLASFCAGNDQVGMLRVEGRDVYRVDAGIREQGSVVTIGGSVLSSGGQR